jgi:hypothetical protein
VSDGVGVWIDESSDLDKAQSLALTGRLERDLKALDVESVARSPEVIPPEAKAGVGAAAAGLVVQLGRSVGVTALVAVIRRWAEANRTTVKVSIGGDVLELSGVSAQLQQRIVDDWLDRHAPGV